MTDDQVVEYVMAAQGKGESQQQIAADLLRRGVSMDQINRIKRKMDNKGKSGVGQTLGEKNRMRTAPQQNTVVQLHSEKDKTKKMTDSEREVMMGDGLGFLFPDSVMMSLPKQKEIFGHRIFQNKEMSFEAAYNLPTPTNYKLGPGDEVAIDIWGASQISMQETISPDGNIYVENLGPVHLSGLTITQANNHLKRQFGQIYSGINGDAPNSNISLSLAQNRTIQVHVMGEVENPGRYNITKDHLTLLDAISMLKETGKYYNVTFVGEGMERNVLEQQVKKLGLEQNVWFYGACYDEYQNAELIYNADLCVAPGNVGLTAMHTMVFGTPVLTHNDFKWQMPEFEAIVPNKTGDFFKSGDTTDLADKIEQWFNDKVNSREIVRNVCYNEIDTSWTPQFQLEVLKTGMNIW
jgi:hypothetical protein